MGRPYADELQQLTACYAQALQSEVAHDALLTDIGFHLDSPFVVVGSGGALSAAKFIVSLREYVTGKPARLATPLEVILNPALCRHASVLIVSAGGSNKDIVAAYACATEARTERLSIFCAKSSGKIVQMSRKNPRAKAFVFPVGGKKDGFLALNSILAFALSVARPSASFLGTSLPAAFPELRDEVLEVLGAQKESRKLWSQTHVVVMHGLSTHAAAFDFESKATEAGLIGTIINDHRNFGHGRHHWIAKHGTNTGVLAFSGPEDLHLVNSTLRAIPKKIPRVHVTFSGDFISVALKSLVAVFYLIQELGQEKGVDPGRPGVPSFGSKIYSLGPSALTATMQQESWIDTAVHRKMAALDLPLSQKPTVKEHALAIIQQLQSVHFGGAAVDFDGTLVETSLRTEPIPEHVSDAIDHLLKLGGKLVICTGRGKSAHSALRDTIPRKHWSNVAVSFYNGAKICRLSEDIAMCASLIDQSLLPGIKKALGELLAELTSIPGISGSFTHEERDTQITFRPASTQHFQILLRHIQERIARTPALGLKCLRSSHSIDVIPNSVSKASALDVASKLFECDENLQFLRVGDMGAWPGNDSELLDHFAGLSVDQVSANLTTAWNFSRRGMSNTESLACYLTAFFHDSHGALCWSLTQKGAMRQ